MNDKFLKPYDSQKTENNIYKKWEKSGYFDPDQMIKDGITKEDAEKFSMVLPPPNVTGELHIGHASMLAIEDIVIRYQRMRGKKTLWIPGTDHAAIATQSKVEKLLSKEGKRRSEMGRENFLKEVDKFAQESHSNITGQLKAMGSSLDWSREAFTLDETREKAVQTAFKRMYDDGLIYQGHRIVNWDPKGQTVISDDEIIYEDEITKFYYFKYGPFTIGTARPETKFGDKYVVMHPDDKRYKDYKHGQEIDLEWINGPIKATIIKDEAIDMEFGTGVMTITPWHSTVDFEIAQRHNLGKEQIIDKYGKLLPIAGEFEGMKITEAREKIVEKLEKKGLLEKIEDKYEHRVATAERTGGVVEPQIMKQWFVDVNKKVKRGNGEEKSLKEMMQNVVRNGSIEIMPDRFEKVYFHWIDSLRDWCISRQIWYGHQIPVWYKKQREARSEKREEMHVGSKPEGDDWVQDEDTLDTWFSSGLWTFSTLGWPEETEDLKTFHPTDLLETGYDILFFWVARMILMSTYLLGEVPFKTVYLHGLVRDAQGRKMSKSLGNGIDPLEMIKKYGADAVRMSLIVGVGPGNDLNMSEDKIRAYKKFSNKIWNASRFVIENTEGIKDLGFEIHDLMERDQKFIDEFHIQAETITKEIEEYKLYLASEKVYHYFWHNFADIVIEECKKSIIEGTEEEKLSAQKTIKYILINSLKILHPFVPFVTEEIWSLLPYNKESDLLMVSKWPIK